MFNSRVPSLEEVDAKLNAPGSPFEQIVEEVHGAPVTVFKHRPPHLRAVLEASERFGDEELFVFEDGPTLSFREHVRAVASVAATVLSGPLVVEQMDSTLVAMHGETLTVHPGGTLVLRCAIA